MLRVRILIGGLVLAASACFDPAASRCQISCASGDVCPGALVCDVAAARCVATVGECSGAGGDGPGPGEDGATVDGAVGSDALPPFEPPTACGNGTLCEQVSDFGTQPDDWLLDSGDGCSAFIQSDVLELRVPAGLCGVGTWCGLDTSSHEIGTGRITAKVSGLSGPTAVYASFEVVRDSASFVALVIDGDEDVQALSVVDGVWRYLGEPVPAAKDWYSIHVTVGGLAVFEAWDETVSKWVELARAATSLRPADLAVVRLGSGCLYEADLPDPGENYFGDLGGGPP